MPTTFDITVTYKYTEMVVPPRCRNPRPQVSTDTMTVSVPCVTREQAPVVLRVPDGNETAELRGYNGDLYEPARTARSGGDYALTEEVTPGSPAFPAQVTRSDRAAQPKVVKDVNEFYATHLIIDGYVWVKTEEPTYEITTFGMGHNHGGTGLFVSRFPRNEMSTHRATDLDAAIEDAVAVAVRRGDTDSVQRIRDTRPIEVLDVSYITRPSLANVRAEKERAILVHVEKVKAALDSTDPDKNWLSRIMDAEEALQNARRLAFAL